MTGHFLQLMEAVMHEPKAGDQRTGLLTEAEKQQILIDFNATEAEYPRDKTIHELFEEQVEKTPDNISGRIRGKER